MYWTLTFSTRILCARADGGSVKEKAGGVVDPGGTATKEPSLAEKLLNLLVTILKV